jgi:hypothetical protein
MDGHLDSADRSPAVLAGTPTGEMATPSTEVSLANGQDTLEQRVRHLEVAMADLHDTTELEARIVKRVTKRLERTERKSPDKTAGAASTGRRMLPAMLVAHGQSTEPENPSIAAPLGAWRGLWFFFAAYAEIRTIIRMFFDKRYRPTWLARTVPIVLFLAILTSYFWLPGTSISLIGTLIDKSIDVILAFLAFKILAWEAACYRAMLAGQELQP